MASLPRSQLPKDTVCLTCGDKGDTSLLIYCKSCSDCAVHHYCLDNFSPDDDNISWWCFDCKKPKKNRRLVKMSNVQVPLFVDNNHPPTSDTSFKQPYFQPADSRSTHPIIEPLWRGWFKIKGKGLCVMILAHLSSIACLKVSDAAAALPPMLDVVLVDKNAIWPNRFEDAPPTATSIGLYFFPACERDETVYDSLLEEFMDNDLALKVNMTDNVELLIFPSSELPLQYWRLKNKSFLWGVFKKTKSPSSKQRSNNTLLSKPPTTTGNEEDLVRSQRAEYPSTRSKSSLSKSKVP